MNQQLRWWLHWHGPLIIPALMVVGYSIKDEG